MKLLNFDEWTGQILPTGSMVLATVELESSLFEKISDRELSIFQSMIGQASVVLWITAGGLLSGIRPDPALAFGLSRSLMIEQPTLKFLTLDITDPFIQTSRVIENVFYVMAEGLKDSPSDFEFLEKDGILHISRFEADHSLNSSFRRKQKLEVSSMRIGEAKPCKALISESRIDEHATFQTIQSSHDPLDAAWIEVNVTSLHLDVAAADFLLDKIEGLDNPPLIPLVGHVSKKGSQAKTLELGDEVVALAPCSIKTHFQVHETSCFKIQNNDTGEPIDVAMLTDCMTQLYAIRKIAIPRSCESFLLSLDTKKATVCALHLLKCLQKEVFVGCRSEEEKQFFMHEAKVARNHLISLDASNCNQAEVSPAMTGNRKFDCVLTSSNSNRDGLRPISELCEDFSCLIDVYRTSSSQSSSQLHPVCSRGISYTALGLDTVHSFCGNQSPEVWNS